MFGMKIFAMLLLVAVCLTSARGDAAESHDAVVLPVAPVTLKFDQETFAAAATLNLKVRNLNVGSGPQQTVELQVVGSDCPGVTWQALPAAVTFTSNAEERPMALIFIADRTDVDSFNGKNPGRCRYTITAKATAPADTTDPTPWNNAIPFELNLFDTTDGPDTAAEHFYIDSIAPIAKLKIGGVAKTVSANMHNTGSATKTFTLHVVRVEPLCAGQPGVTSNENPTATIKPGKHKAVPVQLKAYAGIFPQSTALSPMRCIYEVGPLAGPTGDSDPANDTTRFVADVFH